MPSSVYLDCPSCHSRMRCPCSSCNAIKHYQMGTPWVHAEPGFVACGQCGFAKHINEWEKHSVIQAEIMRQSEPISVPPQEEQP